jgi:hypothetical protein
VARKERSVAAFIWLKWGAKESLRLNRYIWFMKRDFRKENGITDILVAEVFL